jgi:hypothetical protein
MGDIRSLILAADDIKREPVECPEWGMTVIVQGASGTDRDAFEASMRQYRPNRKGGMDLVITQENSRARLLVKCIVDEDGNRVFAEADANALGAKNGAVLDRLWDVASRLSGISEEDVEELMGNSDAAPSGDSSSDSPVSSDAPSLNS